MNITDVPFIVGENSPMQHIYHLIHKIAPTESTVLISGETGTGKEVVARLIHCLSRRRDQAFMCVNCAALAPSLLESELFGHEKGAFTGAEFTRLGRFELADKGTILLDEISEMEMSLQAKLLRTIEQKTLERVGSSFSKKADVRIIATTNHDLEEQVEQQKFRKDLFFRLNVIPICLPPLRERREDIIPLAQHFVSHFRIHNQIPSRQLHQDTLELISNYTWPGNVRELFNIMERVLILSPHEQIIPEDIMPWLKKDNGTAAPTKHLIGISLEDIERAAIKTNLRFYGGNRQQTAHTLGIADRTLRDKIRRYGINHPVSSIKNKVGNKREGQ